MAVALLVGHFLLKHVERVGRPGVRRSEASLQALVRYRWTGDVREPENSIERGLVLCEGLTMDLSCLPETVRRSVGLERRGTPRPDSLSSKSGSEELERALNTRA